MGSIQNDLDPDTYIGLDELGFENLDIIDLNKWKLL